MQNKTVTDVIKALKEANNVMVTVRNSPSVDELTAAVGLTLILNNLNKHALTVFSGTVPSTIEFLRPEESIDATTDSLRDFIIALDKAKADKLRYKVEDNVVRIFITPYRSAITQGDLKYSQGDFNVDVVVALGVVEKDDFDTAVTTHGRILHDATVITVNKQQDVSTIGSLKWQDQSASSVSEMIGLIANELGEEALDSQAATSLLTGIVAETDRFKNEHTTPRVLTVSSQLMAAGANQMLIAEKLEAPAPPVKPAHEALFEEDTAKDISKPVFDEPTEEQDPSMLEVSHDDESNEQEDRLNEIHIDEHGTLTEKGTEGETTEFSKPAEQAAFTPPVFEAPTPLPAVDDAPPPTPPLEPIDDAPAEPSEELKDSVSRAYLNATPPMPSNEQEEPHTALDVAPASQTPQIEDTAAVSAGRHNKVIDPISSMEEIAEQARQRARSLTAAPAGTTVAEEATPQTPQDAMMQQINEAREAAEEAAAAEKEEQEADASPAAPAGPSLPPAAGPRRQVGPIVQAPTTTPPTAESGAPTTAPAPSLPPMPPLSPQVPPQPLANQQPAISSAPLAAPLPPSPTPPPAAPVAPLPNQPQPQPLAPAPVEPVSEAPPEVPPPLMPPIQQGPPPAPLQGQEEAAAAQPANPYLHPQG